MRYKKYLQHKSRFILLAAFATLMTGGTAFAGTNLLMPPPPPIPDAKSYVLMDFQTGQIIAEKDANLQLPPASLTKLMTAYLTYGALANGTLHWHQRIHVSRVAWHTGGSSMFIQPNLPVTVDQLMHGLIIDSGNDAAVALAQAVAGSRASFVDEMNATATKLGLPGAHYGDVDGLPTPDLHLSALDIAMISRDLIAKYPQVINISRIKYYRYNNIKQRSWNPALFGHPDIDGLKTGHTNAAGHCMDTTAIRNGRRLIAVVMGAPNWPSGVNDVVALLDYGYRFTTDHTVTKAGSMVGTYSDTSLDPDKLPVTVARSLDVMIPTGAEKDLKTQVTYQKIGSKGIAKGQKLGEMTVSLNGKVLGKTDLVAADAAKPAGTFGSLWNRVKQSL
ncbi:peptidase M15 [Acidithiobacillus thiooxidans]|uniref:serine-type D-Ala-D-Ala carboxypeptidase n=1 Tax=Acidithiobacillus thiooxidans TaxID=930 RepID=A0A1C2JJS9_ACITH|nr:D-alanyl-D-alanine carboxypeptidase family protein [Acidithiobacillus thiooxidans]OCX73787.1 peptidase M15 [Acidithiobacillus thiooxidans]OCX74048.1 peptidase M15 [Acidithiobacillus thiooxidans]OCX79410.1 peptidase M15 [Acidithiobacillus thiooxidans]OCX88528.1 peptidase M15 [Acidithiobacillus thiooxidans]OFC49576.1 peptidase M15 [Acidithiobacillus thiooxidans]